MSIRQHDFTIERRFRQTPAQAFRVRRTRSSSSAGSACPRLDRRQLGLDFRVGGNEVSVGRDPRGALHEFRSRYHDIVDGERVVFAYDLLLDGRLISVSLTTVEFGRRRRRGSSSPSTGCVLRRPRGSGGARARHRPAARRARRLPR